VDAGKPSLASRHIEVPKPAPPTWQRNVVKEPPLGREVDAAQIVIASERTLAPWTPPKARKRTLEEARHIAAQVAEQARAGADFMELAVKYSDWPFANRKGTPGYGGRLGVLSEAGTGIATEAFKSALSLKVGEVSQPVESQFGVHVFKRLPAPRISEILLTYEGTGQMHAPRTKQDAIELAKKIESDLAAGKSFGEEAFANSDDVHSAGRDGDMGVVVETSRALPELKQAAGRLAVGQVSAPLETTAGIVIVKRTE
jgi:parvulin-like peptidyl-prolyl isomerase